MLVRHLSYFVTLAKEKHFARAAELCHISQPTLSAALRKLEEDLDVPLVVRGHRFMGLTHEGEKLLSWSRQILTDYDSLKSDLSGGRAGLDRTLSIGVVPAAIPITDALTTCLLEAHPRVRLEIRSMSSRSIQQGLDVFDLDGGLTYLENEPLERVVSVPLYHERYVFVTSHRHPFAGRQSVTWSEAIAERLCLLSEDMQNRRIIDGVASSLGSTVEPVVVSDSFLIVAAHLRHTGWSSIVPHTFVDLLGRDDGLIAIDLVEPRHRQTVGLVLSDRMPRSPEAHALLAVAAAMAAANQIEPPPLRP